MHIPLFICVDCRGAMHVVGNNWTCDRCGKRYPEQGCVLDARPTEMSALAKDEAHYHDHFEENAVEVHQLSAWRNLFYHQRLWSCLAQIPSGSVILEVGAGSGFDAAQIKRQDRMLIVSDISLETLARSAEQLGTENIQYVAADGAALPFESESFDALYTVATWHHFEDPQKTLQEWQRVLKKNGQLVIAIEPNRVYFSWIKKLRPVLCRASRTCEHDVSHADAEMEGFSYHELHTLFRDGWVDVSIQPVWLFTGWLHYGLEFFHRALKRKKRIFLPVWLERVFVSFDQALFTFSIFRFFCWHWMIIAKKV